MHIAYCMYLNWERRDGKSGKKFRVQVLVLSDINHITYINHNTDTYIISNVNRAYDYWGSFWILWVK